MLSVLNLFSRNARVCLNQVRYLCQRLSNYIEVCIRCMQPFAESKSKGVHLLCSWKSYRIAWSFSCACELCIKMPWWGIFYKAAGMMGTAGYPPSIKFLMCRFRNTSLKKHARTCSVTQITDSGIKRVSALASRTVSEWQCKYIWTREIHRRSAVESSLTFLPVPP